jgi:hypothetical protein
MAINSAGQFCYGPVDNSLNLYGFKLNKESKMKACTCNKWQENKNEYENKEINNCPFCGNKLIDLGVKSTNESGSVDEQTLILG